MPWDDNGNFYSSYAAKYLSKSYSDRIADLVNAFCGTTESEYEQRERIRKERERRENREINECWKRKYCNE